MPFFTEHRIMSKRIHKREVSTLARVSTKENKNICHTTREALHLMREMAIELLASFRLSARILAIRLMEMVRKNPAYPQLSGIEIGMNLQAQINEPPKAAHDRSGYALCHEFPPP